MLSHPLIVDAAEASFVPVCIFNNTEGDRDAEVRVSFEEPSWNNPVVRFIDPERKDLIARNGRDWTVSGMVRRMVQALEIATRRAFQNGGPGRLGRLTSWLRAMGCVRLAHL